MPTREDRLAALEGQMVKLASKEELAEVEARLTNHIDLHVAALKSELWTLSSMVSRHHEENGRRFDEVLQAIRDLEDS